MIINYTRVVNQDVDAIYIGALVSTLLPCLKKLSYVQERPIPTIT